jgi:anthranilate synthase/aminodeoxychorismate synthase-like glutamine amidotransferase
VVVRNDELTVDEVLAAGPDAVVISPGPGTPTDAGISLEFVSRCPAELPILGICLGHQVLAQACGAEVVRGQPMHGRSSWIEHNGDPLFAGIPNPLLACRYHSLQVAPDSVPRTLVVSAWTQDRTVMALRHRQNPWVGMQFHPESVLTEHGMQLCRNFLTTVGCAVTAAAGVP